MLSALIACLCYTFLSIHANRGRRRCGRNGRTEKWSAAAAPAKDENIYPTTTPPKQRERERERERERSSEDSSDFARKKAAAAFSPFLFTPIMVGIFLVN